MVVWANIHSICTHYLFSQSQIWLHKLGCWIFSRNCARWRSQKLTDKGWSYVKANSEQERKFSILFEFYIFQRKQNFHHQREYLFRFFKISFCIVALTAWILEHFFASTIVSDETADCFSAAINDLSSRKQWFVTLSDWITLTILILFEGNDWSTFAVIWKALASDSIDMTVKMFILKIFGSLIIKKRLHWGF